MSYWWASQTKNYDEAVMEGSLWTLPYRDKSFPAPRANIFKLRKGDVVFHYGKRIRGRHHVGAVSVLVAEAAPAVRPAAYSSADPSDSDDGFLAGVEILESGLMISFERAFEIIGYEPQGPYGTDDEPAQKYLSPLNLSQGDALMLEIGATIPDAAPGDAPRPNEDVRAGETTRQALTNRRLEQSYLRKALLGGETLAPCALCGTTLPASLLVAAHIKKRSQCTDAERWSFATVAMLACLLGCDALYEQGFVTVGRAGRIIPGKEADSQMLRELVTKLTMGTCSAWSPRSAANFKAHASEHGSHSSGSWS